MVTKTVIPDDIKTLKSDVSKLKTDQGNYATKSYVDNKTTWNGYCNVIYDQKHCQQLELYSAVSCICQIRLVKRKTLIVTYIPEKILMVLKIQ